MALSHTARSEWLQCERKYYLSRVRNLELDTQPGALRMGAAFASCLEHGNHRHHVEQYRVAALDADSSEHAHAISTEALQVSILAEEYFQRYGEPRADLKREVAFYSPTLGEGRLDGVISDVVGVEDKLLAPGFWRRADERALAHDGQVTAYFAAMRERGTPLDSLNYRITFKPSIKPDSRIKETLEQYAERLRKKIRVEPEKFFRAYPLFRTDEQMDSFIKQCELLPKKMTFTARLAEKMGEEAYSANLGPACKQFGECAFLSLCADGDDALHKYRIKKTRPKLNENQRTVLIALSQSLTVDTWTPDIAAQSGLPDNTVRNALEYLVKKELAVKGKIGRSVVWHVTERGKELAW